MKIIIIHLLILTREKKGVLFIVSSVLLGVVQIAHKRMNEKVDS